MEQGRSWFHDSSSREKGVDEAGYLCTLPMECVA